MARGNQRTITTVKLNNSKADTALTKIIELVVVNDQLVPEKKDTEIHVYSSSN